MKECAIMAKTALDLTPQELQAYSPDIEKARARRQSEQELKGHWQRAWEVAREAAQVLRDRFGAHRIVVFGSLAHELWFTRWSDVDLAAWGIPADQFYRAVAVVTGLSSVFKVDLVDPESCRPSLRQAIEREGIEL